MHAHDARALTGGRDYNFRCLFCVTCNSDLTPLLSQQTASISVNSISALFDILKILLTDAAAVDVFMFLDDVNEYSEYEASYSVRIFMAAGSQHFVES